MYLGPTAYFLGELAAKLDRPNSAAQHFEAALHMCRTMCSRTGAWRVQQSYARMLIQLARRGAALDGPLGPQARAEQLLTQARQLTEDLSCEPWHKQTLDLMRELQRLPPRLAQAAG